MIFKSFSLVDFVLFLCLRFVEYIFKTKNDPNSFDDDAPDDPEMRNVI